MQTTQTDERRTMPLAEVVEVLDRSAATIYRAARMKQIPALKVSGGWVFPRDRFFRWFDGESELGGTSDPQQGAP